MYFIAASFLVSFVVYRQSGTPAYLKLFPPFLAVTILVEGYCNYLSYRGYANYVIYSYFTALEFIFYLFILSFIITNLKVRSVIRRLLVLNTFVALIDILFIEKDRFTSFAYSLGCLEIIFFSIYYFFELFRFPKPLKLVNEPPFWICLGILFFYCGNFPLIGLLTFMSAVPSSILDGLHLFVHALNIMLYTFFIIAFLCRVRIRKYISQ